MVSVMASRRAVNAWKVGRAIVRVMRDSTRTAEIHRVEELTGAGRYRALIDRHRHEPALASLLRDEPELSTRFVDFHYLRSLPETTLGGAYARHLDDNGITADYQAAWTRWVDEPDIAYLMRRFRQTHDVWHVLLGLGIRGHEEVLLHAFSYGQLRLPVSALVVAFGSLKHMVLEKRWADLTRGIKAAYRMGLIAEPLMLVRWEDHWTESVHSIRETYGVSRYSVDD